MDLSFVLDYDTIETAKSNMMKKLFNYSTSVILMTEYTKDQQKDTGLRVRVFKEKADIIEKICPTLFSISQTKFLIGEKILQEASREKNPQKQNQLIR